MTTPDAVILAAGRGSRLNPEEGHKLLAHVGGRPMIAWHLDRLERLECRRLVVVTGYEHEALEAELEAWQNDTPIAIETAYNPRWELSNGLSVLAGADACGGPFWLLMSDHLFAGTFIDRVAARRGSFEGEVGGMLVVDSDIDALYDVPDANKLRFDPDGKLEAIGKEIGAFDVADTGLFWCGESFVEALRIAFDARGDCNTSDAMRHLDARGDVHYFDVAGERWQDVDTPGARAHAEKLIAEGAME